MTKHRLAFERYAEMLSKRGGGDQSQFVNLTQVIDAYDRSNHPGEKRSGAFYVPVERMDLELDQFISASWTAPIDGAFTSASSGTSCFMATREQESWWRTHAPSTRRLRRSHCYLRRASSSDSGSLWLAHASWLRRAILLGASEEHQGELPCAHRLRWRDSARPLNLARCARGAEFS